MIISDIDTDITSIDINIIRIIVDINIIDDSMDDIVNNDTYMQVSCFDEKGFGTHVFDLNFSNRKSEYSKINQFYQFLNVAAADDDNDDGDAAADDDDEDDDDAYIDILVSLFTPIDLCATLIASH